MFGLLAKESAAPWRRWWARYWPWLAVGLTLLVIFTVRVRLRDMPLERDEGEYAYAGQLILQGVPPYTLACNMKLPGTYAAYALIMAVFGQTPAGIHLGLMLVNMGSVVLMFLLGRRLLDDITGVVAALSFALLSMSPSVLGLAGHATQFVVLPALGGTLLLVKALGAGQGRVGIEDRGLRMEGGGGLSSILHPRLLLLLSGLLFGLAFLMKQHGVFFGLFGLAYLLWVRLAERWSDKQSLRARRSVPSSSRHPPPSQPRSAPARLSHIAAAKLKQSHPAAAAPELAVQSSEFNLQSSPPAASLAPIPSAPRSDAPTLPAPRSAPPLFSELALFLAGLAVPYALTCLILLCAGAFPQFVFWTISYAFKYASAVPLVQGPDRLGKALQVAIGPNTLLWLLPCAGLLVMWWEARLGTKIEDRRLRIEGKGGLHSLSSILHPRFFLLALFLCSLASVSIGLQFRGHYFITLLPVLALLSGLAVSRAVHLVRYDRTIELFLAVPITLLFVLGTGAVLIGNARPWFGQAPVDVVRETYQSTLFTEAAKAADYLKAHTARNARIAVIGSEPEIYFLAQRRSATGQIYTYSLMERQPYARKMQEDMIADIKQARPEFAVYVDDDYSWLRGPDSEHRLDDWWKGYSATNLELVTTFNIEEGSASEEPETGRRETPASTKPEKHLFVYRSKEATAQGK